MLFRKHVTLLDNCTQTANSYFPNYVMVFNKWSNFSVCIAANCLSFDWNGIFFQPSEKLSNISWHWNEEGLNIFRTQNFWIEYRLLNATTIQRKYVLGKNYLIAIRKLQIFRTLFSFGKYTCSKWSKSVHIKKLRTLEWNMPINTGSFATYSSCKTVSARSKIAPPDKKKKYSCIL